MLAGWTARLSTRRSRRVTRTSTRDRATRNGAKGETSGNVLRVVDIAADCDADALLVTADPAVPTCHRGTRILLRQRRRTRNVGRVRGSKSSGRRSPSGPRPDGSYTARLLGGGVDAAAEGHRRGQRGPDRRQGRRRGRIGGSSRQPRRRRSRPRRPTCSTTRWCPGRARSPARRRDRRPCRSAARGQSPAPRSSGSSCRSAGPSTGRGRAPASTPRRRPHAHR